MSSSLPPYLSWLRHGEASAPAPASFTNATTTLFAITADAPAMQALADKFLNPVGAGTVSYTCPTDMALVTFMDIVRATSASDNIGWMPARECAFWVPLLEWPDGALLPSRFVMWSPYIFINYDIGMVTGREVWGWPKVGADIAVASDNPHDPASFACATTFFRTFDPTLQGTTGELFTVTGTAALGTPAFTWATGVEAFERIAAGLLGDIDELLVAPLALTPRLPAIAIKQFRDSEKTSLACYQALVNSPAEITRFRGGGFINDTFTMHITTCESHGIVADFLGGAPRPGSTAVPVEWAAWVSFDFEALPGSTIARRV